LEVVFSGDSGSLLLHKNYDLTLRLNRNFDLVSYNGNDKFRSKMVIVIPTGVMCPVWTGVMRRL